MSRPRTIEGRDAGRVKGGTMECVDNENSSSRKQSTPPLQPRAAFYVSLPTHERGGQIVIMKLVRRWSTTGRNSHTSSILTSRAEATPLQSRESRPLALASWPRSAESIISNSSRPVCLMVCHRYDAFRGFTQIPRRQRQPGFRQGSANPTHWHLYRCPGVS